MNILLDAADIANEVNIQRHPETFDVCRNAIKKCRDWVKEGGVSPTELAHYIDAECSENPWMEESLFKDDPEGLDALIFVTMVIAHVAHFAYIGNKQQSRMSESIAEAGVSLIDSLIEYGRKYGLVV
ncbi:Imm6 family immunity protein [uncultured Herbaspirillum sp.]|uniref:Imm6 family immunity protein n=1 Tax=uncultured Herbaspirillum sp. TaxID=160236 RepID=UPI00258E470A|nr:Imm6 family immunity protein [uncultured Herbaspirillum sp.]